MNTKIVGVVVAIIFLFVAGGLYLSQNKPVTKTNTSPTPTKTENKSTSLMDLLTLNKPQRCTFSTKTADTLTEGTVYISEKKIRQDFKSTTKGKVEEMSMIITNNTSYIWGTSLPTGIKMTLSLDEVAKNTQASQYVNPNAKVAYNCMPWNTDASLFTPPANIKFTDISSIMPKTTGTEQKSVSPCDQITDASAKASCLKAIQGNNY